MKQVLIINGGSTFNSDEDYLESLKNKVLSLDKMKLQLDWKNSLQTDLGDEYQVLVPRMPNPNNAKYDEWQIWFEKIVPILDDNFILVGHSLGGIFLPKYLSENKIAKKITATILVAPPYGDIVGGETLGSFNLLNDLKLFSEQAGNMTMFFSRDDVVVPIEHMEKYQSDLPEAKYIVFNDRGHFNTLEFSELVAEIKSLN